MSIGPRDRTRHREFKNGRLTSSFLPPVGDASGNSSKRLNNHEIRLGLVLVASESKRSRTDTIHASREA